MRSVGGSRPAMMPLAAGAPPPPYSVSAAPKFFARPPRCRSAVAHRLSVILRGEQSEREVRR